MPKCRKRPEAAREAVRYLTKAHAKRAAQAQRPSPSPATVDNDDTNSDDQKLVKTGVEADADWEVPQQEISAEVFEAPTPFPSPPASPGPTNPPHTPGPPRPLSLEFSEQALVPDTCRQTAPSPVQCVSFLARFVDLDLTPRTYASKRRRHPWPKNDYRPSGYAPIHPSPLRMYDSASESTESESSPLAPPAPPSTPDEEYSDVGPEDSLEYRWHEHVDADTSADDTKPGAHSTFVYYEAKEYWKSVMDSHRMMCPPSWDFSHDTPDPRASNRLESLPRKVVVRIMESMDNTKTLDAFCIA